MKAMFTENDSDWRRAFFARLIATLDLLPLAYTLLTCLVPPVPGGAREEMILTSGSISLTCFLASITISHVPYLRERESRPMWHFGLFATGAVIMICALLMYLILASWWSLLYPIHR